MSEVPEFKNNLDHSVYDICWSMSSTECGEIPNSSNPGMSGEATLSTCISLHLIASDRRSREHFRNSCECVPSGKWQWDHYGLEAGLACNGPEQLLVSIDTGAAALERDDTRLRPLQSPCDRLRDVFHIGRLQSGAAATEHRIDGKSAE